MSKEPGTGSGGRGDLCCRAWLGICTNRSTGPGDSALGLVPTGRGPRSPPAFSPSADGNAAGGFAGLVRESVQADWVASHLLWKGRALATLFQICTWLSLSSTLWNLSFHVVISGALSSAFFLPDPHLSLDPEQSWCCHALHLTDDTHQASWCRDTRPRQVQGFSGSPACWSLPFFVFPKEEG